MRVNQNSPGSPEIQGRILILDMLIFNFKLFICYFFNLRVRIFYGHHVIESASNPHISQQPRVINDYTIPSG